MSDPNKDTAHVAAFHRMIDAMAGAIGPIVTAHAASESAHADRLQAQITLVAAILDLARPTVRAIGTRPKISEAQVMNGDRAPVVQLAIWRGLVLTCPVKRIRPSNDEPASTMSTTAADAKSGSYGGEHVFVREDGNLAKLSYKGSCTVQRGGHDEWSATEHEISVEDFCRDWSSAADPKKLAEQLLGFMNTVGDRGKALAKASDLADKFRAITVLL